MLDDKQKEEIQQIINDSLNNAEKHWRNGGYLLTEDVTRDSINEVAMESETSKIPGYLIVQDKKTEIDEFIALVMDMRDSSEHLMQELSSKVSDVTTLQRVFYETSALLPAVEQTIKFGEGSVTEYLGDGVLAFFQVNKDDNQETIREVYQVAKNIMYDTLIIVNDILAERYNLPALEIGIGLSISKALISLVGLSGEKHPKAFGSCVFYATKLSGAGRNEILTDKWLRNAWPSSSGGQLKFKQRKINKVDGYLIERKG